MKKLMYVDIQKGFKGSKSVYNWLKKDKKFVWQFKKRVRVYDNSNTIHWTFWFNPLNLWDKKQNKKLKVTSSFTKKFGWYRKFWTWKIPKATKKNIKKNFKKKDNITLVGWYRKKCLWEVKKTFKKMWYKKVRVKKKYTY